MLGSTHLSRLALPPRDPNQVPPGDLEDAVGTHEESDFNDEPDDDEDDDDTDSDSDEM